MTSVYLAGPIMGTTDKEMFDWRSDLVARLPGCEVFDPTVRDYRGDERFNATAIVEGDKDDIDNCEILIAHCPKPSVGTSMEVLYAWGQGMTVFIYALHGTPISPWLRYHSHAIFTEPESLIRAVLAHEG